MLMKRPFLTGTDSRKGELTESDIDISSSIAIKEDIDQGKSPI